MFLLEGTLLREKFSWQMADIQSKFLYISIICRLRNSMSSLVPLSHFHRLLIAVIQMETVLLFLEETQWVECACSLL